MRVTARLHIVFRGFQPAAGLFFASIEANPVPSRMQTRFRHSAAEDPAIEPLAPACAPRARPASSSI